MAEIGGLLAEVDGQVELPEGLVLGDASARHLGEDRLPNRVEPRAEVGQSRRRVIGAIESTADLGECQGAVLADDAVDRPLASYEITPTRGSACDRHHPQASAFESPQGVVGRSGQLARIGDGAVNVREDPRDSAGDGFG